MLLKMFITSIAFSSEKGSISRTQAPHDSRGHGGLCSLQAANHLVPVSGWRSQKSWPGPEFTDTHLVYKLSLIHI